MQLHALPPKGLLRAEERRKNVVPSAPPREPGEGPMVPAHAQGSALQRETLRERAILSLVRPVTARSWLAEWLQA